MTCTKCGDDIRRGEQRVTITRSIAVEERGSFWERMFGLTDVIAVKGTRTLAAYHERCEPQASPPRSTAMAAR